MMAKKFILVIILLAGLILLAAHRGNSHNNSAPNFECIGCHQGEGSAEVKIDGLPKNYVPGKTYKMTLTIESDNQSFGDVAGGFALIASAGELKVVDKKDTQLSEGIMTHTQEGSAFREWTFGWKAPSEKIETGVDLTIMAVAANGDFSPVGDVVGTDGFSIMPGK